MKALLVIVAIVIVCYAGYHILPAPFLKSVVRHGRGIAFFVIVAVVLAMIAYFTPINPYFQP